MHKAKLRRAGWKVKHARGKWLAAERAADRAMRGVVANPLKWLRLDWRAEAIWRDYRALSYAHADLAEGLAYDAMIRRHGR